MRVLVVSDVRVTENNGKYYIGGQVSSILQRYYNSFGEIVLCARTVKRDNLNKLVDITNMVSEVVAMNGLTAAFKPESVKRMEAAMLSCDLVIGRFHSFFACVAADLAQKLKKPFFAELMGDAWDAFWNHGIGGKTIAPYMHMKTKQAVYHADYALYVTRSFLQERYPCKNESIAASNVRIEKIDPQTLEQRLQRIEAFDPTQVTLMTAAAVDVRYKGQEYVIKAIPQLNKAGLRVRYVLLGGGDQSYLRDVARQCGVEDQVEFTGRLTLDEVMAKLDEADIYIQPSLQEGLPRSVIEAMSRGCPAIGARTAGIPELIAPECVVRRKSAKDIADKVQAIYKPEKLKELAKQNFETAGEYLDEVLSARRKAYFDKIKRDLETK